MSSSPYSPPGQTRCLVPPTWWLRRSIRWWREWWRAAATRGSRSMWRGRRIDQTSIAKIQRRRPAFQLACLQSIQRPARAFPSGPRTMCSWATEPVRSWRCLRTMSVTLNLPRSLRCRCCRLSTSRAWLGPARWPPAAKGVRSIARTRRVDFR